MKRITYKSNGLELFRDWLLEQLDEPELNVLTIKSFPISDVAKDLIEELFEKEMFGPISEWPLEFYALAIKSECMDNIVVDRAKK